MVHAPRGPRRSYNFVSILSESEYHRVYLAHDSDSPQKWVVKEIFPPSPRNVAAFHAAFLREAELQMQVRHLSLPVVGEYFIHDDNAFLVKEYLEGRTIKDIVVNNGAPLPLYKALLWGTQLAEAVRALHSSSPPMILQGLKPNNVVIPAVGRPRIMDLGTARFMSGQVRKKLLKALTPWYSSPEQAAGEEPDGRSDIYSLAALVWFALTGVDPVPSTEGEPPDVSDLRPDLPDELPEMLKQAMQPFPGDRPGLAAFVDVLKEVDPTMRQQPRPLKSRPAAAKKPAAATSEATEAEPTVGETVSGPQRFTVEEEFVQFDDVTRGQALEGKIHIELSQDTKIRAEANVPWIWSMQREVVGNKLVISFAVNTDLLSQEATSYGKIILSAGNQVERIPVTVTFQKTLVSRFLRFIKGGD